MDRMDRRSLRSSDGMESPDRRCIIRKTGAVSISATMARKSARFGSSPALYVKRERRTSNVRRSGGKESVRSELAPRRIAGFAIPLFLLWLGSKQSPVMGVEVQKDPEEWKELLTPEQYHVLIERGTERSGSSPLDKNYEDGLYSCRACDQPLFLSDTKFNSGTGWPSFYDPIPGAVDLTIQPLYLIGDFGAREVRCHRCGSHLGHVFTDGPKPTGKRYCMNGVALNFKPGVKA